MDKILIIQKMSKSELLVKCQELNILKCKSKNKGELVELLKSYQKVEVEVEKVEKVEEIEEIEEIEVEEVFEITINPKKRRKRPTSSLPICNIYIENLNIIYVENVNIIVSNQEQQRKENNEIIILD